MSKVTKIICDLCQKEKEPSQLLGTRTLHGAKIEVISVKDAHHHVCSNCISVLHECWEKKQVKAMVNNKPQKRSNFTIE